MRLERVEVRHVRLPLRRPFETSFGKTTHKEFLLLSVSAGGVTGHGECVADSDPYYLPETNQTVLHVLRDFLVPLAFGLEIAHPRALLAAFARVRGHEMAKAALEMAVWELHARREGAPLYRVLGGRGGKVPTGVSIGLQPTTADLVERVEEEVAAGYRRVKIKIKPGHDRALVEAVRARFPDLPLMVDANSAYGLADAALFREMDRHSLMMVEQPLAWDDIVDHAALQRQLRTPVCLDESIRSGEDARRALALGACRVINIKAGRVGGFAGSLAVHDVCRAASVPVWCGGMLESGIGRMHNVALSTLPNFSMPGDVSASGRYWKEDIIEPPVQVSKKGTISVKDEPGMGYKVREDLIEKLAVRDLTLKA